MKITLKLYYTDWCSHCRIFKKNGWADLIDIVYNNKKFKNAIELEEIDCEKNVVENIDGFPTLMIFASCDTHGVKYGGPRTAEHILKLLVRNYIPELNSELEKYFG